MGWCCSTLLPCDGSTLLLLLSGSFVTQSPTPGWPPPHPSVPEGALLALYPAW